MARDAELATCIARELGCAVLSVREIADLGAVNHVFVVESEVEAWVIRFNRDPLDRDDFAKEEYCLGFARRLGIPSPDVIARGTLDGVPYLVQNLVHGVSGEFARSRELWLQLGQYAATLAAQPIPEDAAGALFPRFGRDPAENWRQHVQYNLDELTPGDRLIHLGVYGLAHKCRIRDVFEGLLRREYRFGLNHGDLVPKNTILQAGGAVVLLDWGSATVGLVPHQNFLRLKNPAPTETPFTAEEIGWFAEGCDVDPEAISTDLLETELLGAIDLVRGAIDRRPDRLDETVAKARAHVEARFGCNERPFRRRGQ